jgi:hypothetical protein
VTLKDWSEPLINIEHLAIVLKDTLNEGRIYHAEGIVKRMLGDLLDLHAAILIAQWEDDQMDRARAKAKTSPVPEAQND